MKFLSPTMKNNSFRSIAISFVLMCVSLLRFDISAQNTHDSQNTHDVPKQLLIDNADILTPAQRAVILDSLRNFAATTSNGIMVVTTDDLQGHTPIEAAYEIGQKAGLGTKEHDNGIVVLVKPKRDNSRGEMAIAVGYGLEGALPDATCKMIIMRQAIPEFQRGDYYTGIMNTLNVIMPIARGEYSIDNYGNDDDDLDPIIGVLAIIFGMALIFFVIGR